MPEGTLPVVVVAAGAAATVVLPHSRRPLWLDESASATLASLPSQSFWDVVRRREGNGVAHTLLLRGWQHVAPGDLGLRVPSLLLATLSVLLLFRLADELFDRRTALLSVPLLVGNPLFVRYAVEARTYALVLVLACASGLLLLRALRRGTSGAWLLYAAVTGAGVYAHYFALLLPLAHAVALLLRRERPPWRLLVAAAALMAVVVAPVRILIGAGGASGVTYLAGSPLARLVVDTVVVGAVVTAASLAVVATARARRGLPVQVRTSGQRWSWTLVAAWAGVPVLCTVAVSVLTSPVIAPRYFMVCLPAAVLVLAAGLARLTLRPALVATVAVSCVGLVLGSAYVQRQTEDWDQAARGVQAAASPGDGVLFVAPYVRIPFDRYWDGVAATRRGIRPLLPALPWTADPAPLFEQRDLTADRVRAALAGVPRVWVVLSHVQLYGGADTSLQQTTQALAEAFTLTQTHAYTGITVQRWDRRKA